jgi:hypothetical protein
MCDLGAGRDRCVMFRTTILPSTTPPGVTAACEWPYVDCPDWEPLP